MYRSIEVEIFDRTYPLQADDTVMLVIEPEGNGASVTLPYTTATASQLQFNGTALEGTLDVYPLSPFSLHKALDQLLVKNILKDGFLLPAIGVLALLLLFFLATLLRTNIVHLADSPDASP